MVQMKLSFDNINSVETLFVKDSNGEYQVASAAQILAGARKAADSLAPKGQAFTSPQIVKDYLVAKLAGVEHEVFGIIFTDNQNKLIAYEEMFSGTIDSAAVYPREVAKTALRLNAKAVIFTHNHPSGSTEPSAADRMLTKRLKEALSLIDVNVLDHIIVAGTQTTSFAENGIL